MGVAAVSTVAQLGKGVKGVSAVAKVGSGAGTVGVVMGVAVAGYEYKTGQANTHTIVDLGVTALGMAVVGVGVIVASPAIIVGAAVGGAVWGIYSAIDGSDRIDKASNDWGKKLIYGE